MWEGTHIYTLFLFSIIFYWTKGSHVTILQLWNKKKPENSKKLHHSSLDETIEPYNKLNLK